MTRAGGMSRSSSGIENRASVDAIVTSQTQARAAPTPKARPCTTARVGTGANLMASYIASAGSATIFLSFSAEGTAPPLGGVGDTRPAQKSLPLPRRQIACTSSPMVAIASTIAADIVASIRLPEAGLSSVSVSNPFWRSTRTVGCLCNVVSALSMFVILLRPRQRLVGCCESLPRWPVASLAWAALRRCSPPGHGPGRCRCMRWRG